MAASGRRRPRTTVLLTMPNGRYRIYVCDSCGDFAQFAGWCLDCGARLRPEICFPLSKIDEARRGFAGSEDDVVQRFVESLLE